MSRSTRHRLAVACLLSVIASRWAAAADPTPLPEGEPLAVEASALVPVDNESSVAVVGIQGQITIEAGERHELKAISRAPGPDGADLPVGIWQVGSRLVLAPAPGQARTERVLHLMVPASFKIAVDATDAMVVVTDAEGSVELRGTNLNASVIASRGFLDANLVGGKIAIGDSGDASLRLRGTALEASGTKGDLHVQAAGGKLSFAQVVGSIDVVGEESELIVDGSSGTVHVRARRGSALVKGVSAGAELELSGTPLSLKDGKGEITVTSDANIEFQGMAASLHFDMYGGVLRGKGNQGILEVRTRNTEVNVESIALGMRIQGDGLKATIADVAGELYVDATLSDVTADRLGAVVAKLDRGSLTLQRAGGPVQANVNGGDVHIVDGNGSVNLELDGGDAEVAWASMSGDKDSRLTNKSGSVTVRLPVSGPCRVAAKSRYGRVDSDVPGVKVGDDLSEAQGPVNGGSRPVVAVDANGDIHLVYGSGSGGN